MIAPWLQLALYRLPALLLALHLSAYQHGVPVSVLAGICARESGCRRTTGLVMGVQGAARGLAQVDAAGRLLARLRGRVGGPCGRVVRTYRWGSPGHADVTGYAANVCRGAGRW